MSDQQERKINEDPTVFDYRPPSLNVRYSSIYSPEFNGKTFYNIGFDTQDHFGLARAAVKHNDNVEWERTPGDRSGHSYNVEYKTFFFESVLDAMKGAEATIVLEDAHGNKRSRVVLQRDVAFVQLAEQFGAPMNSTYVARNLGVVTGTSVGVGQTAGTISAIATDPVGYAKSMTKIVDVVKQLDRPGRLIEAMARSFEQQQKLTNPYDFETQRALYEKFRTNYYFGLIGFEVLKSAAGASATKAAKSSKKLSKLADSVSSSKLQKTARVLMKARDKINAPGSYAKRRVAATLAEGADLGVTGARRLVDSTTIGKALHKKYLLKRMDVDVDDLDDTQQENLNELLDATGSDAKKLANRVDDDTFEDILSTGCKGGSFSLGGVPRNLDRFHSVRGPSATPAALGTSGSCLSPETAADLREGLARAADSDDIDSYGDIEDAVDAIQRLDGEGKESAANLVGELGGDGVRVVNGVDELGDTTSLDQSDLQDLLVSYDNYNDAEIGSRSVADIQDDLNRLAEVDEDINLEEAIREGTSRNDVTNMKGLDGAADGATNILDNEKRNLAGLEVEIDTPEGQTAIDIQLEDGTSIEVKNIDYNDRPDFLNSRDEDRLTKQLSKYAEESDSVVLATKGEPDNVEVLQTVKAKIEANYPETNVELVHIEDLTSI